MHRYLFLLVFLFVACTTEVVVVVDPTPTPAPTSTFVSETDMEVVVKGIELELSRASDNIDWECISKITTESDTPVAIYCDGISYDDQVQFASLVLPKEIGPNLTIMRGFEKTTLDQAIVQECIIMEEQRCGGEALMDIPEALAYLLEIWQGYNNLE